MILPSTVKIGGIDFEVNQVSPDSKELDNNRNWGTIINGQCRIFVDKSLPLQKQQQIFS